VAMCRIAHEDGTRMSVALAHQNDHYPANTPSRIRDAAGRVADRLRGEGGGLTGFPSAGGMVGPETVGAWEKGERVSVADRGQYLLLEMPDGVFVDVGETVKELNKAGVRVILAHPERHPEFLHDEGRIEELLRAGCLVQVSSGSVTRPRSREDEKAL